MIYIIFNTTNPNKLLALSQQTLNKLKYQRGEKTKLLDRF